MESVASARFDMGDGRKNVAMAGRAVPRRESMMISRQIALVVAVLALNGPALVQAQALDDTPSDVPPRYSFSKIPDGFLRLDRQTGRLSLCSKQTVGWACLAAPEDRTALEDEIVRLRRENAVLKENLLARGLPLPRGVMPEPPGAHDRVVTLRLPDEADVQRVVSFVGQVWHRLIEVISDAKGQLLHQS